MRALSEMNLRKDLPHVVILEGLSLLGESADNGDSFFMSTNSLFPIFSQRSLGMLACSGRATAPMTWGLTDSPKLLEGAVAGGCVAGPGSKMVRSRAASLASTSATGVPDTDLSRRVRRSSMPVG